jgi:lysyl-tRNA synthetase class 2
MACLSKRKAKDPRYAERFELYIFGIEIANAFTELTDAAEQRKRFAEEMSAKQKRYGFSYPLDEDFLAALEYGMPECAGIALGFDRLCMLLSGAETIDDVLWSAKPA